MRATIPMSTPLNNFFSLVLYDKHNKVRDAAMNIAGREIQSGLNLLGVPLHWSRADVGKPSKITIGFEVKESSSSQGDWLRSQIGEILINFPDKFIHMIDSLAHVELSRTGKKSKTFYFFKKSHHTMTGIDGETEATPGMSVATNWLDYTQKDRIRINLRAPPGFFLNILLV